MRNGLRGVFALLCALAIGSTATAAGSGPSSRTPTAKAGAKASAKAKPRAVSAKPAARPMPQSTRMVKISAAQRSSFEPGRRSIGQVIGLHRVDDPLDLRSSVALLVDQRTGETLFSKNDLAVLPIASITKLMTALVVLDAQLPLAEVLEITDADIDTEKFTRSRLRPGTQLTRGELLQLALMSSENRAANALGRHYPGGLDVFVAANEREGAGARHERHPLRRPDGPVEPQRVQCTRPLAAGARCVRVSAGASVLDRQRADGGHRLPHGELPLDESPDRQSGLVDRAAEDRLHLRGGRCLVMQVSIEGRSLVMVLLDADGARSRFGDAQRLRTWIEGEARRPAVRADSAQVFGS